MFLQELKRHLSDNHGEENTSKMAWVAIVFVVGAILLLLTTTAFKQPIQDWYNNVIAEWFHDENGQYSYDKWAQFEKYSNGLYKGLEYVCYESDGGYVVVHADMESMKNEANNGDFSLGYYTASGGYRYIDDCFNSYMSLYNGS